jgi:hypothetical protein
MLTAEERQEVSWAKNAKLIRQGVYDVEVVGARLSGDSMERLIAMIHVGLASSIGGLQAVDNELRFLIIAFYPPGNATREVVGAWQLGDVRRDPPRLVRRQYLRRASVGLTLTRIDKRERLAGGVNHLQPARYLLNGAGSLLQPHGGDIWPKRDGTGLG